MRLTCSNKECRKSDYLKLIDHNSPKRNPILKGVIRQFISDNRGFSLIEAIITVVVVGIITVPLTMTFIHSLQDTVTAKEQLKATQLAQLCIENIKAKSHQDLMSFFDNDPMADGIDEEREITANQGYKGGFPDIPNGYKVKISYDTSVFTEDKYLIHGGSSSALSYDATFTFTKNDSLTDKTFTVGDSSETDRFTQKVGTTDRIIYITYEYDSDDILIQDDSDGDKSLETFRATDLNPMDFEQNSYNILINCSDTTVRGPSDDYATKIYVVNETVTPVNLFIYQNPLTTVKLSINDADGKQEGEVHTYYNMQEYVDETHKIYVVRVEVLNDKDEVLSTIETTKVIE